MSALFGLLNRSIAVTGLTDTGTTDGGGNPIYTTTSKGTVKGRIDPKVRPDVLADDRVEMYLSHQFRCPN